MGAAAPLAPLGQTLEQHLHHHTSFQHEHFVPYYSLATSCPPLLLLLLFLFLPPLCLQNSQHSSGKRPRHRNETDRKVKPSDLHNSHDAFTNPSLPLSPAQPRPGPRPPARSLHAQHLPQPTPLTTFPTAQIPSPARPGPTITPLALPRPAPVKTQKPSQSPVMVRVPSPAELRTLSTSSASAHLTTSQQKSVPCFLPGVRQPACAFPRLQPRS
ncbi:hypothetical protein MPTK1_2g20370 [Marchantia polymorpha subsp. ruderalis]|uniref:Uncharacterized protein n=1 Tax=Marchantia polymorpha TaxID=3197 RepID=A0A2R6WV46_MARPO|nr:hypothetical protein MARPO_0055s0012 [Marchantia polymorpha]BBN03061.1 hypothetical protein Mp_2g20370 [Marchantia polymorpha subsp. ruderalis]|eukprot:PTQ37724.1 hypothetical protein MARPO_0055s0012 [Marchantia polymorpha]